MPHKNIYQITKIIGGQYLQKGNDLLIKDLLIDSRQLGQAEHTLFFAIKGLSHNGHDYIPFLIEQGVKAFIVSEAVQMEHKEVHMIQVPDVIKALQDLAAHHRQQFDYPVIGITGSNGKTVVKEWLYQLLQEDYNIVRSPKSYNSQVGVPLSVWQMNAQHQLAIFEAGISEVGEMEKIARVIQPNIGVFTNLGEAHNKGFVNHQQKLAEKWLLFKGCETILSVHTLEQQEGFRIIDVFKHQKSSRINGEYKGKKSFIELPFTDDASIENAIHCWMVLLHLGIDEAKIQRRFKQLVPVAMRLELLAGEQECTLINDCYNSDLTSLRIALDFLSQQKQHPKQTVILSDILQTGQDAAMLYQKVADLLTEKRVHRFIGVGENLCAYQHYFQTSEQAFFPSTKDLLQANLPFWQEAILVKGARSFGFERLIKRFKKQVHDTILEINLNAIANNLRVYKHLIQSGVKLMVMVKAFSYGSGSHEIANLLRFHQVDYLAVAYTDEGVALRKAGIDLPIMVMNPRKDSFEALIQYNLEPELYSLRHLRAFLGYLKYTGWEQTNLSGSAYPIHLKLDTGMHRLGFEKADLRELNFLLKYHTNLLEVKSIFTHLAASDEALHDAFSQKQIEQYQSMAETIKAALPYPILQHVLNSSGITRFPDYQMDMVRLGIGLYGIDYTGIVQDQLFIISRLKTYISQIKSVPAGETVGYSRKGTLMRPSKIATVGIGYGDGLSRQLSNGLGKMWLRGQLVPIVGNVCMDMCMLDVTDVDGVMEGDEVIVFGPELPPQQLAIWQNTIAYEILTGVSARVRRVYYQE